MADTSNIVPDNTASNLGLEAGLAANVIGLKDSISTERIKLLHPAIKDEIANLINQCEIKLGNSIAIRIVQGLRTIAEQNALYAIGRTLKGANATPKNPMGSKVTNAKGGSSWHNYGLAIDFALLYDKEGNGTFETLSWDEVKDFNRDGQSDWREVVSIFKNAGYEWGGDWHSIQDDPHLEKRFGMPENCSTAYQKFINKQFIPNTQYIVV